MKVQIQTTQNVDIEYEIASIGDRIGAALIDTLIRFGYIVAAVLIFAALADTLSDGFSTIFGILFYLPIFFYDALCETLLDGQTFGKKALKIKVVKMDGTQPGVGSYLLRWLVGLLEKNGMAAIGIVAILVNGKGQRLGDMAAGTTVIKVKPEVTLDHTIFAALEEEYHPTFTQVARLSDNDIAIIQEVLNSPEQSGNPVVVGKLVSRVKQVLEVEPQMPPVQFLRTVVKDYNYYTGM